MLTSWFRKTLLCAGLTSIIPPFFIGFHIPSVAQHNLERKEVFNFGVPHFFYDKTEVKSSLSKGAS